MAETDRPERDESADSSQRSDATPSAGNEEWQIPLEDDAPSPAFAGDESSPKRSAADLDVCPSCGAPMPDPNQVVCMRCGFDMVSNRPIETRKGTEEVSESRLRALGRSGVNRGGEAPAPEAEPGLPVSPPGRGGLPVAGAVAIVTALLLFVGYLTGMRGLFGDSAVSAETMEIPFGARLIGVLKLLVLTIIWLICSVIGMGLFSQLMARPFGDLKLVIVRMLAAILVMRLWSVINLNKGFEQAVEWPLEAATFVGVILLFFAIKPRDVVTFGGITLLVFVALWLSGMAIDFAV